MKRAVNELRSKFKLDRFDESTGKLNKRRWNGERNAEYTLVRRLNAAAMEQASALKNQADELNKLMRELASLKCDLMQLQADIVKNEGGS